MTRDGCGSWCCTDDPPYYLLRRIWLPNRMRRHHIRYRRKWAKR